MMHSDLEEGEIRDEEIEVEEADQISCEINEQWKSYFCTNGNNNILKGTFGKITLEKENQVYFNNYPKTALSFQNEVTTTFADGRKHSKCKQKNRRSKIKCSEINYKDTYFTKRRNNITKTSSRFSDCSNSAAETSFSYHSKTKSGHIVKQKKKQNNSYMFRRKNTYSSNYSKNKITAKESYLSKHKKGYFDSFEKSISKTKSNNIFGGNYQSKLPKLNVGITELIKPGSIGEILLKRKTIPIEIVLSDTDCASPPATSRKVTLSDDENLMILRRKALDSFNKSSSNHSNEYKISDEHEENSSLPVENQDQKESVSIVVESEPIDMEISDDESIVKDKTNFPIEWAYMVPPPESSKDDSIQTMNRWCYDQNMYVQAMQSLPKSEPIDYQSVQQLNHNETKSEIAGKSISCNEEFCNVNLIGGHAKQYEAFMANFCKDQQTVPYVNSSRFESKESNKCMPQCNLIQIPLQQFSPEHVQIKNTASEISVDEEYDEDLLLATLLIDQEKRAQKREDQKTENNKVNNNLNVFAKKRSKKQGNFKRKNQAVVNHDIKNTIKIISNISDESKQNSYDENSTFFEYENYKFPKVKPVIINLQSDSENESEQLAANSSSNINIDQFIRNIRHFKDDVSTKIQNSSDSTKTHADVSIKSRNSPDSTKTPKALTLLSKNQQEAYKKLKETLRKKMTNKSQISKTNFVNRKPKCLINGTANKISAHKFKSCKFNFSMPSPLSTNEISEETIEAKSLRNKCIKEVTSHESETPKYIPVIANAKIMPSTLCTENIREVTSNISSELKEPPIKVVRDSALNSDDEILLRKCLLESLKPKNYAIANINSNSEDSNGINELEGIYKKDNNLQFGQNPDKNSAEIKICNIGTDLHREIHNDVDHHIEILSQTLESRQYNNGKFIEVFPNVTESIRADMENDKNHRSIVELKKSCSNMYNVPERTSIILQNKLSAAHEKSDSLHIRENSLPTSDTLDIQEKSSANSDSVYIQEKSSANSESVYIQEKSSSNSDNLMKENLVVACEKLNICNITPNNLFLNSKKVDISVTRNIKGLLPLVQDKSKKDEDESLLRRIEQEIVKERNKVFSSTKKLAEDIKQSERFFIESKSIISLIVNIKSQLLQAEQKLCNKKGDAESHIDNLYAKTARLKKDINRSNELQCMGEKLGKQIVGNEYTLPPTPSNYEAECINLESDISSLNNRIRCLTTLEKPNLNVELVVKEKLLAKDIPTIKQAFKIDRTKLKNVASSKERIGKSKCRQPENKLTTLNAESCSDANVLCPHDLLGRCNDESCIYIHLQSTGEEYLPKPTSSSKINQNSTYQPPIEHFSISSVNKNNSCLNSGIKTCQPNVIVCLEPSIEKDFVDLKKITNVKSITVDHNNINCGKSIVNDSCEEVIPLLESDVKYSIQHTDKTKLDSTIVQGSEHHNHNHIVTTGSTIKLKKATVCLNRYTKSEVDSLIEGRRNTIKSRLRKKK